MQQIADLLKSKNIKVTPQRLAIYNVLCNTKEHPSAEGIYHALQSTHPTMSLATVYKTLDSLKQVGLVQELNTGGECFRYDATVVSHPHAICLACGDVYDIHTDKLDGICQTVQDETDFILSQWQVYFYGTCPTCQEIVQH